VNDRLQTLDADQEVVSRADQQFATIASGQPGGRPLRLLFVTQSYLTYTSGVESHVRQVAQRLVRWGVDVTVLASDPSGRLPPAEESEGVAVRRVRAWPSWADYYFAPGIWSAIVHGHWDLIHIQCYHTFVAPFGMLAALRTHTPYLVTFHTGGHSSGLRNALRGAQIWLLRPLLTRAERLVTLARFESDLFGARLEIPAERFVMIPNGSDLQAAAALQPRPPAGATIASVGRLERYKGHHRILAAMPEVLRRRPDARLLILGTGPYKDELQRMVLELGLAGQVQIRSIPPADRQAMAETLSMCAMVVLLSEFETHPIAVLEALSLGRPALVADTSGLAEIAEAGLARAIPLHSSPQAVASAVLEQLEHPLIPEHVHLPTWDECASQLLALYQDILEHKTPAAQAHEGNKAQLMPT